MELSSGKNSNTPKPWLDLLKVLTTYSIRHGISDSFSRIPHHKKVLECYKNDFIRKELSEWIGKVLEKVPSESKCVKKSQELRNLGNVKFKQGDDETSLKLYTESIIHAPHGSSELSLALGNRSAVLFRLQQYENCVKDIDLSIKNYKIGALYYKLIVRKGKSLFKMKRIEDGLQCLNLAKELISADKNIPGPKRNEMIDELTNEFYCNEIETSSNDDIEPKTDYQLPQLAKGSSDTLPFASNMLKLEVSKTDDKNERKVVACDDIDTGDILFVETPYSFVILPDYYENHCQTCCKLLTSPIACSECVDNLFCDEDCFKKAYDLYHKWECRGIRLLHNLGVGHLAFKTVLIAAHDPQSAHYKRVNELLSHLSDVAVEDLVQYALTATLMVVYLEEFTDFFKSTAVSWKSIEEISFALLKHIIQAICNGFAIKKSSIDNYEDMAWLELSQITYATGIYSSASMMNHSCGPNIITSFFNNHLVVRAAKKIAKGEEIFNCYGPHYRKMKTEQRREILRAQFFFDCKCQHCSNSSRKDDRYASFICPRCKHSFDSKPSSDSHLKCTSCSHIIDSSHFENIKYKMETLRKTGALLKDQKDYESAISVLQKCVNLQHSFMNENNTEILYCCLDLAECYFALEDYTSCWKSFKKCVPIVKEQCGEYSIEYADILKKTIDMFLLDVRNKNNTVTDTDHITDILTYVDQILKIVEFNFGSWSLEYSSLQSQKTELVILISCGAN